ncbi:DBF4-type zinc finger-containing protein 2 [Chanos chanos]|uniref:DBF4-type zinc finger-containing protein 2 n=1 Tax=Chanos chanos TaxID=29144 RepID=A0A6J2W2F8_CHACN|nr:DBF4-type zinc finger-containing protein 2 [Chanos chanos]
MPTEEGPAPSAKNAEKKQANPPSRQDKVGRTNERDQPVAGPSSASHRQGFCSCCQVLYNNLEQHILSPRHREVVRSTRTNVASGSLMERFLQDVLHHHPHRYNDTRPTHADLPNLSTPLVPREELSEVYCGSDSDRASVGTREELPSSDEESCHLPSAKGTSSALLKGRDPGTTVPPVVADAAATTSSQTLPETGKAKLDPPSSKKDSPTQGFLHRTSGSAATAKPHTTQISQPLQSENSQIQAPSQPGTSQVQHRKAHRKTNRHIEESDSAPASPAPKCITSRDQPCPRPGGGEDPDDPVWTSVLPPWKGPHRERTFSVQSDQVRDVIEEVIERYCYGRSPRRDQKEDEESFHVSLQSMSDSGVSEGWDDTVKLVLGKAKADDKNLACLMEVHVDLEDQGYKTQLDSALNTILLPGEDTGEMGPRWAAEENAAEEVLPDLPHIPQSFVGKTLAQVMFEDDLKVDSLVKEFRQGRFRCYFESESLARFGKHIRKGKKTRKQEEKKGDGARWDCRDVLPLMEHHEEEPKLPETFRKTRRRLYRLASRCQVVKVSHGTQTTPQSCPMIKQRATQQATDTAPDEPQPPKNPSPERTPDMKTRLCALRLPASYCRIMSPVQPKTVVYVLSSPDTAQGTTKPTSIRRTGRKRKSCDSEGMLKYKYKKTPLKYYDPLTNRILKTPPKGTASAPKAKLPHVRQLFRSLSPDINKEWHGVDYGREGRSSRRARTGSSLADLCASTSGSAPSEPDSSASSNRRAMFSRSSISSGSRFLLSTLTPSASHTDGSSRAPAKSRTSSSHKTISSKLGVDEDKSGIQMDRRRARRRSRREGLTEKPLTPAKRPSAPPYRTRRVSTKSRPRAKSCGSLQRKVSARKSAECRTSPRNRSPARASPRLSASPKPTSHKPLSDPPSRTIPNLESSAVRKSLRGRTAPAH